MTFKKFNPGDLVIFRDPAMISSFYDFITEEIIEILDQERFIFFATKINVKNKIWKIDLFRMSSSRMIKINSHESQPVEALFRRVN